MISEANLSFWIKNQYNVLFRGKHGVGKCLGKGTPILMFDGTIKPVEEVQVNDLLMGPDSKPRKVLSTCSGNENLYKVIPVKGDSYIVNESHILSLKMCSDYAGFKKNSIVNINVVDFKNKSSEFKTRALGWRTGVEFVPNQVPLDPYFIGLWLGDGSKDDVEITTADDVIVNYLYSFADSHHLEIKISEVSGAASSYRINIGNVSGSGKSGRNKVRSILEHELKLFNNKHIPLKYKSNSKSIRLSVLAGLIDSNGSLTNSNCYDYISKIEELADDVCFLARSLGFAAYKKQCQKGCWYNGEYKEGTYYRVTISGNIIDIPVKLAHKKASESAIDKDVLKSNLEIEYLGEGEYFGFEIDGDHLFLLGDFTVTHNTATILGAFANHGLKFQYFSASTMDPWVDFIGVPKEKTDENGNSYLDLVRPKHFQDDQVEAIFLDEFNRSSKKVRNAVMELIQFKSINGKKFNNLKIIWAAINPEDNEDGKYDVEALDPAQLDRFHVCVDVPYTPNATYFREKYGQAVADVAITWWKELDKAQKNLVSPRRLDYAIDMYTKGGDIKFVLPNNVNTNKLVLELSSGSISKKLKTLFETKNEAESKSFLAVENNYDVSYPYILKQKDYQQFFLPLLAEEKLIGLMTKNKDIENFVFNQYDKFKDLIKNVATSKSSHLAKRAQQIIKKQTVVSATVVSGAMQGAQIFFTKNDVNAFNGAKAYTVFSLHNTYDRRKVWRFYNNWMPEKLDEPTATEAVKHLAEIAISTQQGTIKSHGMGSLIGLLNHACKYFIDNMKPLPIDQRMIKILQKKHPGVIF